MAKTHKLASSWDVIGGILYLSIEARRAEDDKTAAPVGQFKRSINLPETFDGYTQLHELGQAAIEFGIFTSLRNGTGSCDTIAEAEAYIDRRLEAFSNKDWGTEREGSAVPFTANHALAAAVEKATKGVQTAVQAAERLSEMAHAACVANNLPAFAAMEPAERSKLKKQVIDAVLKSKPAVAAAHALIEAERQAAAAKRKADAAIKAAAAAEGVDETGL